MKLPGIMIDHGKSWRLQAHFRKGSKEQVTFLCSQNRRNRRGDVCPHGMHSKIIGDCL